MTRKLTSLFIAMLLTISYVAASGLTISGVYYDPVQADRGEIINYPHFLTETLKYKFIL